MYVCMSVWERDAIFGVSDGWNRYFAIVDKLYICLQEQQKSVKKKNPPALPLGMIVKVKPQAKKAKIDQGGIEEATNTVKTPYIDADKTLEVMKTPDGDTDKSSVVAKIGLVSYSDDSDDE